jgi:hypothetical protein
MLAASTGTAIAMGLGGVVAVLAICAVFYVIGRSEDRDRAADSLAETPPDAPAAEPGSRRERPPRPRSPEGARRRRRP